MVMVVVWISFIELLRAAVEVQEHLPVSANRVFFRDTARRELPPSL